MDFIYFFEKVVRSKAPLIASSNSILFCRFLHSCRIGLGSFGTLIREDYAFILVEFVMNCELCHQHSYKFFGTKTTNY